MNRVGIFQLNPNAICLTVINELLVVCVWTINGSYIVVANIGSFDGKRNKALQRLVLSTALYKLCYNKV